jgi:hypothetical protein
VSSIGGGASSIGGGVAMIGIGVAFCREDSGLATAA